jgi:AraC family transcriptional regulator
MDRLGAGSYFGRTLRRRVADGLILTETRYPAGLKLPRHAHAQPYFCLVLAGSFMESDASNARECRPADCLVHRAGSTHSDAFHRRGARCFNVELAPEWMTRVGPHKWQAEGPTTVAGDAATWLVGQIYREFRLMDSCSPMALEGLVLALLAEAIRGSKRPVARGLPPWLARARDLIDDCFATPLSLGQVARAVGVHPVTLAREFRRRIGVSVCEYVRRRRVQRAARALSCSETPIAQVALDVGFSDHSHLTRLFKRTTGYTPSEYRRSFSAR